jgi:ssRNA-specific RNase YbeY (16S rRNA maturation enzyme)
VNKIRERGDYGETDPETKIIKIKKSLGRVPLFLTVIHELLHVVEFEHNIKMKHKVVYQLEKAIFEILLDNFL